MDHMHDQKNKPIRSSNRAAAEDSPQQSQPSDHDLLVGLASDPGCVRDQNQDASLAWQFVFSQSGAPPLPLGLYALADGMGGHALGEQASSLAIRLVASYVIRHFSLPMLGDDEDPAERPPINEVLETSLRLAHDALRRKLPEAGTTLTMALILGNGAYIAHVGDSRAYQGRRGHLACLTQDHSIAARLIEMGQAPPDEMNLRRNVLYKALGQGNQIEPDILYCDLPPGSYLLLCCDGLWGKVTDAEMMALIEQAATPDFACQHLVARAKEQGGEDNISAILVARGWPLPGLGD
jgi:serine/threonine protein phosphatase PrpC